MALHTLTRGLLAGWFCGLLLLSAPAQAAEPEADSAPELVRQALRAELVGDNQIRRQRLEAAAARDPDYGPAQWQQGKVRLPGQAMWRSLQETAVLEAERPALFEYRTLRDDYVRIPDVIWSADNGPGPRTFRRRITLAAKPQTAEVRVVAWRPLAVAINGNRLKLSNVPGRVGILAVSTQLRPGENTLAIQAEDGDGPAGLMAWFGATFDDDRVLAAPSDGKWQVHSGELASWTDPYAADVGWIDAATTTAPAEAWDLYRQPVLVPKLDAALARWCDRNHLDAQAQFHWRRVLEVDARNKDAIKALDLVREDGWLWTREESRDRRMAEKEANVAASRWKARLVRLQNLAERNISKELIALEDDSEAELTAAVGPILAHAAVRSGDSRFAKTAVRLIDRIPEPAATQALVEVTILARSDDARQAALETLKKRDSVSVAGTLLPLLHMPLQMQVQQQTQPQPADFGSSMAIRPSQAVDRIVFVDRRVDHDAVHEDLHTVVIRPQVGHTFRIRHDRIDANRDGAADDLDYMIVKSRLAVQNAEARQEVKQQEMQARQLEARTLVDQLNLQRDQINLRVFEALEAVTHQNPGRKVASWWEWWIKCNSLVRSSSRGIKVTRRTTFGIRTCEVKNVIPSCFIAGTPVWTRQGLVPIEQIRAGDEVLSQDTETGELAYKLVTFTTIRPPSPILSLTAGGDSVTTTLGHRFWRTGAGWIMAKQVAPGIPLHRMDGSHPLDLVTPAGDAVAYNLVVDDFHTYFVGQAGWLVHDNRLPVPGNVLLPGLLAEPGEMTSIAPGCGLLKALNQAGQDKAAN